jgi:Flp pilus assembly secretin CpaC
MRNLSFLVVIFPAFLALPVYAQTVIDVPEQNKTDVTVIDTVEVVDDKTIILPVETPLDKPVIAAKTAKESGQPTMTTHPVLNMMPDKSELIRLPEEAASVAVGNPNHINVMLDTPDTLIVVPRTVGASHFSVIGESGKLIMQRHVVVGAPQEQYVRVRRSCNANSGRDCRETSVYFCPNMCHEVEPPRN